MPIFKEVIPPAGVVRLLAIGNLAKLTANGVILSITVLYFTRVAGIAVERVGLALTAGAAIGMLAGVPAGRVADLRGPRPVTMALLCGLGLAASGYALVTGFAWLIVLTALVLGFDSASQAAIGSLVAGLVPPRERPRALAYMRSTANVGVSLGVIAGGFGLLSGTRAVYLSLFLAAGVLFVVSGLTFLRLPSVRGVPSTDEGSRLPVLRDLPYAAVSLVNSLLMMSEPLLTVAVPLWISLHTSVPVFFYTVMLLVNTTAVILFQVRVSKGVDGAGAGSRAWWRAGVALAVCCAFFAVSAGRPLWLACVLLIVATLVHVFGEMLHSAGAWALSYGLAPEDSQGQYQGLFEMSTQLGVTAAPFAITAALAALGSVCWLVFAGVFLLAGQVAAPLARWAEQTRPEPPAVQQGAGRTAT
jgi:MFS family permease